MPFRSEAQRRFLYAREPAIAKRWQKKTPKGTKLPETVGKCVGGLVAKLIDTEPEAVPVMSAFALVGKLDASLVHSLIFAKRSFRKKRAVRVWLRLHGYRLAYVSDGGGEWVVRQKGSSSGTDIGRVSVESGVEAVVSAPDMVKSAISPLPLMPPIGGASGPSNHTPEMPDFESLYAQPEAQKRMDKEAEQSRDRRRSMWRDFNFMGFHGIGAPDEPVLRYIDGETSTADVAIRQPRHFLTAEQLRQNQKRIQTGTGLGYETVQGQTDKRKKSKAG